MFVNIYIKNKIPSFIQSIQYFSNFQSYHVHPFHFVTAREVEDT
jgi:hypothetical protein